MKLFNRLCLVLAILLLPAVASADETPPLPPKRPSAVLDLSTRPPTLPAGRLWHPGNIATYQPRYLPDSDFYVAHPAAGHTTQMRWRVRIFVTGGELAGFSARDIAFKHRN